MTRVLLLTILMLGPPAGAQILPGTPLPGLPGRLPGGFPGSLPAGAGLPAVVQQAAGALTGEASELERARQLRIRLLLRRHPDALEADPNGDPVVRGEVLAFSPTDAALTRALGAGFTLVRQRSLRTLGIRIVVLAAPRGTATSRALRLLRRLDPAGTYDFNNIYTQSGGALPQAAAGEIFPGARRPSASGRRRRDRSRAH